MTTTISSSDSKSGKGRFLSIYRFVLRQNGGYFALSSALIFLFYPLQYLMEIFKELEEWKLTDPELVRAAALNPYSNYELYGMGNNFTGPSIFFFAVIVLFLPFFLGMVLNSYMHSKKAADVYHALPIRREMLLGVNAAVAMTIVVVPVVISNIIIAAAALFKFQSFAPVGYQFLDMVSWLACAFLIYCITVLVCTQVGTVFDTFLFSGVAFFILPCVIGTVILMGAGLLYGFSVSEVFGYLLLRLSPVLFPFERFFQQRPPMQPFTENEIQQGRVFWEGNFTILAYFVVGALFLWLAMRLYARRHSERAEMTTSKGFLPTAVQIFVTWLGGIYVGMLFYGISGMDSKTTYYIWCVIGGLLTFAVAEVILNRGFKTLIRRLPVGACMMGAAVVFSVVMMTGGLGYEHRVPKLQSVKSVELNWQNNYAALNPDEMIYRVYNNTGNWRSEVELTSEEAIQNVLEFHEAAAQEQFGRNQEKLEGQGKIHATPYMRIKYNRTGLPMSREYVSTSTDTLMKLAALEVSEEFQRQANPFFIAQAKHVVAWTLSDLYGWESEQLRLTQEESQRLLEAVQADYLALTPEEALNPSQTVVGYLQANVINADSAQFSSYNVRLYTPVFGTHAKEALNALLKGDEARLLEQPVTPPSGALVTIYDKETPNNGNSMIQRVCTVKSTIGVPFEKWKVTLESSPDEEDQYYEFIEQWNNSDDWRYTQLPKMAIDDSQELTELAQNVVPSYKADEPYAVVWFYPPDGTNAPARGGIVPLSRLSVDLQNKLLTPVETVFG